MEKSFTTLVQEELFVKPMYGGIFQNKMDDFHEGLNSVRHTFLIYKDTLMTEEQIKAQRDFFIRRYNIDADSVV